MTEVEPRSLCPAEMEAWSVLKETGQLLALTKSFYQHPSTSLWSVLSLLPFPNPTV